MGEAFSEGAMFEYDHARKLRFALITYGVLLLVVLFVAGYFSVLQHRELAFLEFFREGFEHVSGHISSASFLGMLYASVLGGLFFVTIPIEVVFVQFLRHGAHPLVLILTFLGGFVVSFSVNYLIGMKLDALSKRIITPQKFYKFKGVLNRRGGLAVFAFNAIPFFPAQPLSAVLGVFRYNRAKFYVYFLSGQLAKFAVIAIIYIYILGLPGVTP